MMYKLLLINYFSYLNIFVSFRRKKLFQALVAVVLCTTATLAAPQRPSGGADKDAVITSQQLEVNFDGNYINK